MWPKAGREYSEDARLLSYLSGRGVAAQILPVTVHRHWETKWRGLYQNVFLLKRGYRQGAKAIDAYLREPCTHWFLVPFLSRVPGTVVHPHRLTMNAFECYGTLQDLEDFMNVEFFVSPPDLTWTLVRTHEDFSLGGPYFARVESLLI